MKRLLFAVLLLASSMSHAADEFPVVWSITDGLQAPESAYFDAESGFLFLSQIGDGGGMGKDGDGWISMLTTDGKFVENKWVTGLNAPKGVRSHKGTLWVSDIDRIVAIDIKQGKIAREVKIDGAKFLNDLACGPDGAVYVADMLASRIYKHHNGRTTVFAEGDQIESPNGLLVDGKRLILAAWGKEINDDFTSNVPGRLLALDLKTGRKRTVITKMPTGNLDGVESDGNGGWLVTDWIAGKVFHITGRGKTRTIMSFPKGAADHAYLVDKNLLILPEMLENKLTAFDLSKL